MTSANKSLEKKNFHQVENIIKQLVHTPSVRSSRYEAIIEPFFCLITFNCVSVLHISIVHAHDISKQIPREKNFHQVENIIKQLVHTPSVRSSRYEAIIEPFFCLITFNCVSVLHISIVHAHDISKQIPREKNFHQVENIIKQLVHTPSVRSSRYEALGKFGEHSRS